MSQLNNKKKLKLFDDDDDNNDNDGEAKEYEQAFDKALNKKQFQGDKGRVLFELQKSINNSDQRFTLNKTFKDDVSYRKLPQSIKEVTSKMSQSKDYEYNMMNTSIAKDEEIMIERNKNLSVLSTLLTNTEYLSHKPKESNVKKILIKRYDPQLNLGDSAAKIIKEEEVNLLSKKIKEDNIIRLEKGVEVFKAPLLNPYLGTSKHQKELKKREKEKIMREKMNEINDNMNAEVNVNIEKWKATFKAKPTSFSLFGDNTDTNNDTIKEQQKDEPIVVKNKSNTKYFNEDVTELTKRTLTIVKEELSEKEKIKRLLRNKTKREKKKEKMKFKKQKALENEQAMDNEYELLIQEQYGSEKGKEYLRYIDMIRNKNKKK